MGDRGLPGRPQARDTVSTKSEVPPVNTPTKKKLPTKAKPVAKAAPTPWQKLWAASAAVPNLALPYMSAVKEYVDALRAVTPTAPLPQSVMYAADTARAVQKKSDEAFKAFREVAPKFRGTAGFEVGRAVVQFKDDAGKRSPKWKEEAAAQAEQVYMLQAWIDHNGWPYPPPPSSWEPAEPFDAEAYEKGVLERVPKDTKTEVTLAIGE